MAIVFGIEIKESDNLPGDPLSLQLNLVTPLPQGADATIEDGKRIYLKTAALWVIQLGFEASGHSWLNLNWMHGALPTSIEPNLITITTLVESHSFNQYPFSASFVFENKVYVFDPTIIDCPPGT